MHKPGSLGKGKWSFSYSRSRTTVHQLLLSFLHPVQDVLSLRASFFKCYQARFSPEHLATCVVFMHLGCLVVSLSGSLQRRFETDLGKKESKKDT